MKVVKKQHESQEAVTLKVKDPSPKKSQNQPKVKKIKIIKNPEQNQPTKNQQQQKNPSKTAVTKKPLQSKLF